MVVSYAPNVHHSITQTKKPITTKIKQLEQINRSYANDLDIDRRAKRKKGAQQPSPTAFVRHTTH